MGVASPSPHPCSFQWYHNYLRLHGKTQPHLLVKSAVDFDAGEYYCVVANKGGTTDTEIAFVKVLNPHSTVSAPPATVPTLDSMVSHHGSVPLSGWPGGASGGPGGASGGPENTRNIHHRQLQDTFSMAAPAGPPTSMGGNMTRPAEDLIGRGFQGQPGSWSGGSEGVLGGGGVGGATAAVLASGSLSSRRGSGGTALSMGEWCSGHCVRNHGGNHYDCLLPFSLPLSPLLPSPMNTSPSAEPVVCAGEKPKIMEHPQSQTVDAGDPLTLHCRAVGSQGEQMAYLWYFNGLSLQQEVRPEYFINCFTDEDEGMYFCKVSNYWGEVDSDMAHVQMKDDD